MNHPRVPERDAVAPARHLFLSPHYDDIALSAGGMARLAAKHGSAADIALIFGSEPDLSKPLTPFAEQMHAGWGLNTAEVVRDRRAEEAAASAILGATDTYLPFQDAIYRDAFYDSNQRLFDVPSPGDIDLPQRIVQALKLDVSAKESVRIYAPLGIGFHVDHQAAFGAAKLLADDGWTVWLYEDLPYAILPDAMEKRLNAIGDLVTEGPAVAIAAVWQERLDAIMCFPSQLPTIFDYVGVGSDRDAIDAALRVYAGPDPLERYWVFK